MLKLLTYLMTHGMATQKNICPPLSDACLGMPRLTEAECNACNVCQEICPTAAIAVSQAAQVQLDLGACISCGLCVESCPTGTIERNSSTRLAVRNRQDLILGNIPPVLQEKVDEPDLKDDVFRRSLAVRVVSTGCSACDLEIGAACNPLFDLQRFGVQIVSSPRFADCLVITGPVSAAMKPALWRTYQAMPEPRKVIALGTCAISGGIHKGGYAQANGVDMLPVDVYIPGCPPHPWSILHGLFLAMGRDLSDSSSRSSEF